MSASVCSSVFFFVQTRVFVYVCIDINVLVYASHKKWLYLATEMGLCQRMWCEHVWERDRDGELRACLKPSFVWAMYALCGGKLKNISMIKAG